MKKQTTKKITKEWIELTLCDMTDEIMHKMTINAKWKDEVMKTIKKYSLEIYNSQK